MVERLLKFRSHGTVLDLGAGTGRHSAFLADYGFEVTAVDIQPIPFRDNGRGNPQPVYLQRDTRDYVPEIEYDIIIATMLLNFLSEEEGSRVINTIQAATKIGGLNVLSVLTKENINVSRPHLFSTGELERHYVIGWHLLHYEEGFGRRFFSKAKQAFIRQHRAGLIAERDG